MSGVQWHRTGSGDLWGDHALPEPRPGRETFDGNMYGHTPITSPLDFVPERIWLDGAACVGHEDLFDRAAGVTSKAKAVTEAKGLCTTCPVRQECLSDAMEHESGSHQFRWGIRGGLTERERADLWSPPQPE